MRIVLIDDHAPFRTALRALLASSPGVDVAGEAECGEEGVALVASLVPDITLMDLRMPGMGGIAATAAIRARDRQACVLVLTTFDEDDTVIAAMRAGASGYLLKGTPIDDMLAIMQLALRGYIAVGPGIDQHRSFAARSAMPPPDERIARFALLTERERSILALIAQGYTNRDVAARLYLSEGTVKNYVSSILGTLALRHRTEAALLWRAAGFGDQSETRTTILPN